MRTLKSSARRGLLGAALALAAAATSAAPLTWTLDNVRFEDGAVATGSFVYDADANVVTDVSITKSGGLFGAVSYTTATRYNFPAPPVRLLEFGTDFAMSPGSFFLDLIIATDLTNAGGIIDVVPGIGSLDFYSDSFFGTCLDVDCVTAGEKVAVLSGARLVAQAVPEPASALLVLAAGLALTVQRRQRPARLA